MTSAHPSSRTSHGGRRHGRVSEESNRQTRYLSNSVKQWCSDRNLPERSWVEPLVIVLYVLERAADTWKPERSILTRGLKVKSLAAVSSAVVAYGEDCHLDMSSVVNHQCITHLIQNLRRKLPWDQVAPVRAQPLTDERVETLLSYIDRLERMGFVHEVWACRWRVLLLVARASALRPSEIVRMRFSWIRPHATGAAQAASITVPVTKSSESPTTVFMSAEIPGGVEALKALDEWTRTVDGLGYPTTGKSRVFPRVERDKRGKTPYRSVAGKTLADFPQNAASTQGASIPRRFPQGKTRWPNGVAAVVGGPGRQGS